jgi:hypothetical protein
LFMMMLPSFEWVESFDPVDDNRAGEALVEARRTPPVQYQDLNHRALFLYYCMDLNHHVVCQKMTFGHCTKVHTYVLTV